MSLNGLDDVKVKEAHEFASHEPGGWFLLKYASRDEIELLSRGSGGIVELRNAIAQHDHDSPLFGFLRYRRRNVLLKYVPETCSRLIQARVTVHFNAVTEHFSPYDTTFTITASSELRDTSLSAACSLHTASGSTSSSTSSIRKRMLIEIAEDDEEEQKRQSLINESPPSPDTTLAGEAQPSSSSPPHDVPVSSGEPPLKRSATSVSHPRPASPTASFTERRKSSQTVRPELYSHGYKPRVKLGPRPSFEAAAGRPHTAGNSYFRPIATLPAGMKMFTKGTKRTKDRPLSVVPPPIQPAIPETTDQGDDTVIQRPHTSGGTPSSNSAPLAVPEPPKTPTLTPEKARLMRALELRKKQMSMKKSSAEPIAEAATETDPAQSTFTSQPAEPIESPAMVSNTSGNASTEPHTPGAKSIAESTHADSAIAVDTPTELRHNTSSASKSDSAPPSPIEPSENGDSTVASSVSESTDETLKGHDFGTNSAGEAKQIESDEPTITEEGQKAKQEEEGDDGDQIEASVSVLEAESEATGRVDEDTSDVQAAPEEKNEQILATKSTQPTVDLIKNDDKGAEDGNTLATSTKSQDEVHSLEALQLAESHSNHTSDSLELTQTDSEAVLSKPKNEDEPKDLQQLPETLEHTRTEAPVAVGSDAERTEPVREKSPVEENSATPEASINISPERLPEQKTEAIPAVAGNSASEEQKIVEETSITPTEPEPDQPGGLPTSQETPAVVEGDTSQAWDIPRSKFSAPDLKASSEAEAQIPAIHEPDAAEIGRDDATDAEYANEQDTGRSRRPRPIMEPIRINTGSTDRNSIDLDASLTDDDLINELESATVQQAQPIIVAKSPISPTFPVPKKTRSPTSLTRTLSNSAPKETPATEPQRSVSASSAYLTRINQQQAGGTLAPKKVNLGGSSVSQRIKALERLSFVGPAGGGTPPINNNVSATFFSVRKPSVRVSSQAPSIAERANSLTRKIPSPSPTPSPPSISRDPSPDPSKIRQRASSFQKLTENLSTSNRPLSSRGETISVTAKIIRDPAKPFVPQPEVTKDNASSDPLDLKQSPLVIDHQKAARSSTVNAPATATARPASAVPTETHRERRLSNASNQSKKSRSSLTIIRDYVNDRRQSLSERRKSIEVDSKEKTERLRSPTRPPSTHWSPRISIPLSNKSIKSNSSHDQPVTSPLPLSANSSNSSVTDDKAEQKSSRASRLLRRMSSSLTPAKKSTPTWSPTLAEEAEPTDAALLTQSTSQASNSSNFIEMGDVNVQFPDTLLWKRRFVRIDSQGFLVLAPVQGNGSSVNLDKATNTRRFHLSDFRQPYIPDLDAQELPNSVVLDFVNGSQLQLACEDRAGQRSILNNLEDSYRAWVN